MNIRIQSAMLTGVIGLLAVSGTAATYPLAAGDLIIGFSTGGSTGTDLVYDLGAESTLVNGLTWNLGSALTGYNLSSLYWGVIGVTTTGGNKTWLTYDQSQNSNAAGAVPATISGGNLSSIYSSINAIYGAMPAAGVNNSYTVSASSGTSWTYETINGTAANIYRNNYPEPGGMNPNELGTGVAVNFYQVLTTGADPTVMGSFTLDSAGVLSFSTSPAPVPEPSVYGLLAAGLLLLPVRRLLRNT